MQFTYDHYKRLKQSKLFLKNPQGMDIGWLSGIKELKLKVYFNSVSEMSFKVYEYEDGIQNPHYDLIEILRLIEMQYIAVFQIQTVEEINGEDIPVSYKQVTCKTLENELINKYIDNIEGVFSLYDVTDQEHSLLHIIPKYCSWTVGHVDSELLSKWRTFSIDSSEVYSLLNTEISKSFDCVFQYNTFEKTINCYSLSNIGKLTNIIISDKNILKQYEKKSDLDRVSTKMSVYGGQNSDGTTFDLRAISIDGSTELINIDYYKVPFDPETNEGWMSQGLVDAIDSFQDAEESYNTQHTTALNNYKQYQEDLLTLQNQLTEITSQISAQEQVTGTSVKNHNGRPPITGESDYVIYQTAISQISSLNTQKVAKELEITNKNNQIISVQATLDNISSSLDKSNYFTSDQLKELDSFLTQGSEYNDSTFLTTDETTTNEAIQMKLDLKANAEKELATICRPQFLINTNISNLWTIHDDKDSKISYSELREDCVVGNLITLKLRKNYSSTIRLMVMEFDFDNLEEVSLTFSDKSKLDDELTQLGEIISQAQSTSKSLSMNIYGYDKAASKTSTFNEFMSGALDATLNKMRSSKHEETVLDEYGLHMKRWDENTNTYSPYQAWWNAETLMFSDDSFASAKMGIGRISAPDGNIYYGIATDAIIGNFILSSALTISNENNTVTINKDGANFTNCDIIIQKGINTLTLNAADGIKLTKNGVRQFGIDANGDAIFSGLITGGSLNINNNCTIDSNGYLSATGATFTGGSFSLVKGANDITLNALSGITSNTPSGKLNIDGAYIMGWNASNENKLSIDYGGNISCNAVLATSILISNYPALHVDNLVSQCQSNGLVVPNASNASTAQSSWYLNNVITANYSAMYPMEDATISCGKSGGKWSAVYAGSGTIITSDRNKKNSIQDLDDRYLDFANKINPQIFKYNEGTSDRYHVGFIAQSIEEAMTDCNLSDKDFAGLVKSPKYLKKMIDDKGNELDEFDTSSEIVGYDYSLRYDEFIPLLYAKINKLESEISNLKNMITL